MVTRNKFWWKYYNQISYDILGSWTYYLTQFLEVICENFNQWSIDYC